MSSFKDTRPEWVKKIHEATRLKLLTEEEYEEGSEFIDELYYFSEFIDNCPSVFGVSPFDEKYGDARLRKRKIMSSAGFVDRSLAQGIKLQGLNPEDVPLIPIVEYKLVPTGKVEYFDATLPKDTRRNRRFRLKKREQEKKMAPKSWGMEEEIEQDE